MPKHDNNYLKEIITTLADHDVDFIICGGVALVLHGIERVTMDLDLSVDMNGENLKKFLVSMKKLGMTPRAPVPADSILDPDKRQIMIEQKNALVFTFVDNQSPYRQVDIFLADGLAYDTLKDHVELFDINGKSIQLVSKKKLLEMKKAIDPPRDKDIFDIRLLEKLLQKIEERE